MSCYSRGVSAVFAEKLCDPRIVLVLFGFDIEVREGRCFELPYSFPTDAHDSADLVKHPVAASAVETEAER